MPYEQLTLDIPADESETESDSEPTCPTCDRIEDECECYTCEGCDARVESLCSVCDECDSCCSCVSCSGRRCNYRGSSDNICSTCERCTDGCCECYYCEGCDERVHSDSMCGGTDHDNCNYCQSCCEGHSSNSDSLLDGALRFHSASRTQYKLNPSKRFISLEVEVSEGDGTELHRVARRYKDAIVEDGSLPDEGWELNMNPSQGDVFLTHVSEIAEALSDAGAKVSGSCGMHCHIDARDFRWFDLFKLCRLYSIVEDGLFEVVSKSRRDNRYCMTSAASYTFADYKTFKSDLIAGMYNWRPERHKRNCGLGFGGSKAHKHSHGSRNVFSERSDKYNGARYRALNIHSFFYRGTVEFRHHQGTTNAVKMQNWGMVCASIVDAANTMTLAQIDNLKNHSDSFASLQAILRPELQTWAAERRQELRG